MNDNGVIERLAETYLETYTLEELLELSDLTEQEIVERLISIGLIPDDLITQV